MKWLKFKLKWKRKLKKVLNLCKHTHIMKLDLPESHWYSLQENKKYKQMGLRTGVQLKLCYICGKVWAEDWKR